MRADVGDRLIVERAPGRATTCGWTSAHIGTCPGPRHPAVATGAGAAVVTTSDQSRRGLPGTGMP